MINAIEARFDSETMRMINRPQAEITNRAAVKLANEVEKIEKSIHNDLLSIDEAIASAEDTAITTRKLMAQHKQAGDFAAYISDSNELEQIKTQIKTLKEDKADLINEALPPDKYRELLLNLISIFDSNSRGRRAGIREHLAKASKLMLEEFDDQHAYQRVIDILQYGLRTEQNKNAAEELALTHYSINGISLTIGGAEIFRNAEALNEMTKTL